MTEIEIATMFAKQQAHDDCMDRGGSQDNHWASVLLNEIERLKEKNKQIKDNVRLVHIANNTSLVVGFNELLKECDL